MTLAITLLATSIVCLLIAVFLSWRSANIRIHFEFISSSGRSTTDAEADLVSGHEEPPGPDRWDLGILARSVLISEITSGSACS